MTGAIQPNQSYTIRRIMEFLHDSDWDLLYHDLPGTSRGGTGTRGEVFRLLEGIKSPTPDILVAKGPELQVVEVDSNLQAEMPNFRRYRRIEGSLLEGLRSRLGLNVTIPVYAFGRKGVTKAPSSLLFPDLRELPGFRLYYLDETLRVHTLMLGEGVHSAGP